MSNQNQEYSFIANVNLLVENLERLKDIAENILDVKINSQNIEAVKTNSENIANITNISENIEVVKLIAKKIVDVVNVSENIEAVKTTSQNTTTVANVSENIEAVKTNNQHIEAIVTNHNNIEDIETNSQHIEAIKINAQNKEAIFKLHQNITWLIEVFNSLNMFKSLELKASHIEDLSNNLESDIAAFNQELQNLIYSVNLKVAELDSLVNTAAELESDIAAEKNLLESVLKIEDEIVLLASNLEQVTNATLSKEKLEVVENQMTVNSTDILKIKMQQNKTDLQVDLNYAKTLARLKIIEEQI